jgi:UDP-N-acetylmuramate: L-alanyl-gamma-D-glutamyl-meso-diaminopimelate ligase
VDQRKKLHFIAIGSSETYHLAAALQERGHVISTSDDQLHTDIRSKLDLKKLVPAELGWHPEKIDRTYDAVIIGTQTNKNNPELLKAQQLGLKIYTGPEYIYEVARNKHRIVVVGSVGRANIASIIVHVLRFNNRSFDFVLSDGAAKPIQLSDAPLIVIDGSESRSSAVYHTPQFIKYKHHIGIFAEVRKEPGNTLSENDFIRQFDLFADATPKAGVLIYWELDKIASVICNKERPDVLYAPYKTHPGASEGGKDYLINHRKERIPVAVTGKQALVQMGAAFEALKRVGITQEQFYKAIPSYGPAS